MRPFQPAMLAFLAASCTWLHAAVLIRTQTLPGPGPESSRDLLLSASLPDLQPHRWLWLLSGRSEDGILEALPDGTARFHRPIVREDTVFRIQVLDRDRLEFTGELAVAVTAGPPPDSGSGSSSSSSSSSSSGAQVPPEFLKALDEAGTWDAVTAKARPLMWDRLKVTATPEDWREGAVWHTVPFRKVSPGLYPRLLIGDGARPRGEILAVLHGSPVRGDVTVAENPNENPTLNADPGLPGVWIYLATQGVSFQEIDIGYLDGPLPDLVDLVRLLPPGGTLRLATAFRCPIYRSHSTRVQIDALSQERRVHLEHGPFRRLREVFWKTVQDAPLHQQDVLRAMRRCNAALDLYFRSYGLEVRSTFYEDLSQFECDAHRIYDDYFKSGEHTLEESRTCLPWVYQAAGVPVVLKKPDPLGLPAEGKQAGHP
jgi:hypothetical protein